MAHADKREKISLLTATLIASCSVVLLSSAYHSYTVLESNHLTAPMNPQIAANIPAAMTAQNVISANLFNVAEAGSSGFAEGNAGLPELRGTFAGSGTAQSYAIMAEPGQAEKSYKIGDKLSGGAKLTAITSDHIVIVTDKIQHIVYLRPKS